MIVNWSSIARAIIDGQQNLFCLFIKRLIARLSLFPVVRCSFLICNNGIKIRNNRMSRETSFPNFSMTANREKKKKKEKIHLEHVWPCF